ncbi:MAG TPA: YggT family protein [Anaerolineales bacterium]
MGLIIQLVRTFFWLLTLVVLVDIVLSYFMSPFHPLRQALDRIVEPMLAPVRRIMPQTGMLDFSPLVLLILLQIVEWIIIQILVSI